MLSCCGYLRLNSLNENQGEPPESHQTQAWIPLRTHVPHVIYYTEFLYIRGNSHCTLEEVLQNTFLK